MGRHSNKEWLDLKKKISFHDKAFIGGKFCNSNSGETFECINPSTGKTISKVANCSEQDVNKAVKLARSAFENGKWSDLSPTERKSRLLKLSSLIMDNIDEFALLDSLDMGKPVEDCAAIDVPGAAGILQWTAEAIDKVSDEISPTEKRNLAMVKRIPLGVVGAVVPWNFPLDMAIWKCAPALATGNSVLLKPAEQSPLSALKLAELSIEAGIPDGVFNVLPGYGHITGKAIGMNYGIDCVAFTGSTEIGKRFLEYSSMSNMKQVWLECGGKSPNIIFNSCNKLEEAASMAAQGAFFNQGEVCSANSRILVQNNIAKDFINLLMKKSDEWLPGDPLNPLSKIGCVVSEEHAKKVNEFIDKAKQETDLIYEGKNYSNSNVNTFISPTIFKDNNGNKEISRDEVFGPVASIIPFETQEEAISIANNTNYGLAASVWSDNLSEAHFVADKVHAGTISVNTMDALSPMTPFGGFKESGFGKDLSLHSFDKYTGLKTVWIKY